MYFSNYDFGQVKEEDADSDADVDSDDDEFAMRTEYCCHLHWSDLKYFDPVYLMFINNIV